MGKPPYFRDTPLYWFMALAAAVLAAVQSINRPALAADTIEVTIAGPCCDLSACPVAAAVGADRELSRRRSDRETIIKLQVSPGTSPRQLWEAIEGIQRRPLRLISEGREFVSKPNF